MSDKSNLLKNKNGGNFEAGQIRAYRLRSHHLDRKLPPGGIIDAAGACGLQNTPPGAWETALYNRLHGCTVEIHQDALYRRKILLQAWSFRGVPAVFPTDQSDIFLTPLIARHGEQPWIYTRGITAALDYMKMTFDDLLPLVVEAAKYLEGHTVKSKEALDRTLSQLAAKSLTNEKQALWNSPSMYGAPDKQTVGGAIVSFMLRPCSFSSLVVFGERQGSSPSFTSFKNWTGHSPKRRPEAGKELARKYLRCYGPANQDSFMNWLGCSPHQAKRLWEAIADEMEPVQVRGAARFMLSADMEKLRSAGSAGEEFLLLGPHDPYLGLGDKEVILENKALQRAVWTVNANPGVILKGGRIAGVWRSRTQKESMDIKMTLFECLQSSDQNMLRALAEQYAEFRLARLRNLAIG